MVVFFSNRRRGPSQTPPVCRSVFGAGSETVPLLAGARVFSLNFVQKEGSVLENPSGSVSNVVAQEHDVVCDDGSGLASHLVLVHILSIVQFSLH